jgi:hypothetical protein
LYKQIIPSGLPPSNPLKDRARRQEEAAKLREALDEQVAAREMRAQEERDFELEEGREAIARAGSSLRRDADNRRARRRAIGNDLREEWDRQVSFRRVQGDLPPVQPHLVGL